MKDQNFKIKIWDVLHTPWYEDTLSFSNKFSTELPHLWNDWISYKITLKYLSDEHIMLIISRFSYHLLNTCDKCWLSYQLHWKIKNIQIKAAISLEWEDTTKTIPIDVKNSIVDLEKWTVHTIMLEENVVNLCTNCEEKDDVIIEETLSNTQIIRKEV